MEQIVQEKIYREVESHIPRPKFSSILLIMFTLLIGFAAIVVSTRALAQCSIPPPDPFPAYADIFPGQPESAVKERAFSCSGYYNYYNSIVAGCTITRSAGIFSKVSISISEGIIRNIIFFTRDNSLTMGDLVIFLKTPASNIIYHFADFYVPGLTFRVKYGGSFSLFVPVQSISLSSS